MIQEIKSSKSPEQETVIYGAIPQTTSQEFSRPNDEIDLVDLWLIIYRRKWLLLLTTVFFVLAGGAYSVIKPMVYTYSASLQVGALVNMDGNSNRISVIENPEFVVSRLTETIIPFVLHQYQSDHPDAVLPDIKARIPKKSDLIVIETRGPEQYAALYTELINRVAEQVVTEHRPLMALMDSNYSSVLKQAEIMQEELEDPSTLASQVTAIEVDLVAARLTLDELNDGKLIKVAQQELETKHQLHKNKLSMLDDDLNQVKAEIARLEHVDQLLKKQIAELNQSVTTAEANRQASLAGINDEPSAMTLLLLDNQIQSSRDQLSELEERLYIKQPALRDELNKQLNSIKLNREVEQKNIENVSDQLLKLNIDLDKQRRQQASLIEELEQKINKLKLDTQLAVENQISVVDNARSRLDSLKSTRLVFEPIRSMEPAGARASLIIVVALMMGLFFGLFLIFGLEFKARVHEKVRQQAE